MSLLSNQYNNPDNLKTRIGLYKFSTAEMTLHEWITSLLPRQKSIRILELGCGTGLLWKHLIDNYKDCEIILSDNSPNMLDEARTNLEGLPLKFEEIDFHNIPYERNSFDLVISNHNLYHAEDLDRVLKEISRILTPQAMFVCSTNSRNHLIELKKILAENNIDSLWPNQKLIEQFGMENGEALLSPHFATVRPFHYKNNLHITDPEAIINYFLSVDSEEINTIIRDKREKITKDINRQIEAGIYFQVQTEPGLFICHK